MGQRANPTISSPSRAAGPTASSSQIPCCTANGECPNPGSSSNTRGCSYCNPTRCGRWAVAIQMPPVDLKLQTLTPSLFDKGAAKGLRGTGKASDPR